MASSGRVAGSGAPRPIVVYASAMTPSSMAPSGGPSGSVSAGSSASRPSFSMMGFLATSFAVVGLVGIFATYAIPIPYERLLLAHPALAAGPGRALVTEAHAIAGRMRLLIGIATLAAALFGIALLGTTGRRSADRSMEGNTR